MSQEQDQKFFKRFSWLLVGIALAMFLFFIIASQVGYDSHKAQLLETKKAERATEPVAKLNVIGDEVQDTATETQTVATEASNEMAEPADSNATAQSGESVYNGLCVNCHGVSALAAMIPQTGSQDAWQARIEKGIEKLYENAINGYTGELGMMPAKGGNLALSDEEVKAAVDYMIEQSQ